MITIADYKAGINTPYRNIIRLVSRRTRLHSSKRIIFQFKIGLAHNMKSRTNIIAIALLVVTGCTTIDGILLDCTFGMYTFTQLGSIYTCTARPLFDGIVNENVTAVYGNHQTGKGDRDVRAILLQSRNLEFVPTNIEYFFPNIFAINLYNNSITTIGHRHLRQIPNLQYLWLNFNKITTIDGDLFSGMNSMRRIGFSNNNIRHVGHDLNLPVNGHIEFSTNPCITQAVSTPAGVASLKLNLLRNCPPTISQIEDSLENRPNLLTHTNSQVQILIENVDAVNDEVAMLRNEQVQLWERIAYLEAIIDGNKLEARPADQRLIDTSEKMTNEVTTQV